MALVTVYSDIAVVIRSSIRNQVCKLDKLIESLRFEISLEFYGTENSAHDFKGFRLRPRGRTTTLWFVGGQLSLPFVSRAYSARSLSSSLCQLYFPRIASAPRRPISPASCGCSIK